MPELDYERQVNLNQVATFLKELHGVPVDETLPATLAPVRYADWIEIRRRVEDKIYLLCSIIGTE